MILRRARGPVLLAISAVFSLAGCGDHVTSKATDPTPGGTSAAPTTAVTPSGGDLETACRAAADAANGTVKELFDHPNDLAAAASTYAKGAKRLRDVGAGTPIETEVNQLATTMESISGRLARGVDDGDTSVVPRAAKRLQEACGIQ